MRNLARGGVVGEVILLNVVEVPSVWVAEGFDFISLKDNQKAVKKKVSRRAAVPVEFGGDESQHRGAGRRNKHIQSLIIQKTNMSI